MLAIGGEVVEVGGKTVSFSDKILTVEMGNKSFNNSETCLFWPPMALLKFGHRWPV